MSLRATGRCLLRLDQTLGELIPERIPADADTRAANVTVEDLLTMTSGWEPITCNRVFSIR